MDRNDLLNVYQILGLDAVFLLDSLKFLIEVRDLCLVKLACLLRDVSRVRAGKDQLLGLSLLPQGMLLHYQELVVDLRQRGLCLGGDDALNVALLGRFKVPLSAQLVGIDVSPLLEFSRTKTCH